MALHRDEQGLGGSDTPAAGETVVQVDLGLGELLPTSRDIGGDLIVCVVVADLDLRLGVSLNIAEVAYVVRSRRSRRFRGADGDDTSL